MVVRLAGHATRLVREVHPDDASDSSQGRLSLDDAVLTHGLSAVARTLAGAGYATCTSSSNAPTTGWSAAVPTFRYCRGVIP